MFEMEHDVTQQSQMHISLAYHLDIFKYKYSDELESFFQFVLQKLQH